MILHNVLEKTKKSLRGGLLIFYLFVLGIVHNKESESYSNRNKISQVELFF